MHKFILPETRSYLASIPNMRRIAGQDYEGTSWARRWDSREEAEAMGARWLETEAERYSATPERGVFLGLRADENSYRRTHLRTLGPLFQNQHTQKWHCNPIAWWSTLDVWAYIYSRKVPYNRAYDRMDEIGVPMQNQRIGPFAVERALGYGMLAILKKGWPDVWNEYAALRPEARSYA